MIPDIVWYEFSNYSISPLNFIIHHSFGTWELKLKFFKGFLCSFKIVVKSNILLSFFLNIIILKCLPFFKRSKDKKKPKSFRQAKWQFLSTKTSRSLLLTTLNCFINLFLCSSSKQTFNLKAQNCLSHILKLCTISPNMEIYNWVPPTKFTGARMTALKKRETFYIG